MPTIGIGIDESTRDSSPTDANLRANSLTLNSSDPFGPSWSGSNEVPTKDAIFNSSSGGGGASVLHLFMLAGQSNAGPHDTGGGAPTPAEGTFQWTSTGGVEPLSNAICGVGPDGGACFGFSMVPQFANTYRALTGAVVGFVGKAKGGSAQVQAAESPFPSTNGNWDPSDLVDSHVIDARARYLAARAAFEVEGYTVIDAGILWLQGEQDALAITAATITQAQYQTVLTSMIAYFRSNLNADLPFYIVRTGQRTDNVSTGNHSVRMGQENVAAADPNVHIIVRDTVNFTNLGFMHDTIHYNQAGQNYIGEKGAEYVAGLEKPYVATAATVSVSADNQVIQVNDKEVINLLSNSATAANRTIQLSPPLRPGHKLTLVNASGSFFVQLLTGGSIIQTGDSEGQGTVQLSANWSASALNDTVNLISPNGFDWVEISAGGGGGGGGAVTSIIAGAGVTVDTPTGDVTVSMLGSHTGLIGVAIANATVASTTTETSVIGTLNSGGTKTTGANFFATAGTSIRLDWSGFFSSLVTDTLTIRVKAGSTVVGATAAVAYGAVSNQVIRVWSEITCRSIGVSGTFIVNTFAETAGAQSQLLNTSTVTLDTTAAIVWDVTAQWSFASASNTITGTNFVLYGFGIVNETQTSYIPSSINTSIATPTDTGLSVPLLENSRYAVEVILAIGCNNTGGVYIGVVGGGTAKRIIGTSNTNTTIQRWLCANDTIVSSTPINTVNATTGFLNAFGTVTTTSAETLKVQYQPAVGGQTATIFQNGSYLLVKKLA